MSEDPSVGERACLAVFAKYPEPGKCKTRLIGELSAEQAAAIQEAMTRHLLRTAQAAGQVLGMDCVVFVAGADCEKMAQLYGAEWKYRAQEEGDLGDRLVAASEELRQLGYAAAIFVGTDCPAIDVDCLAQSQSHLLHSDVCIAPATDGGYVLLGMRLGKDAQRSPIASPPDSLSDTPQATHASQVKIENIIFDSIDWGSERVLNQTLDRIEAAELRYSLLPSMDDVDRPEDVAIWEAIERLPASEFTAKKQTDLTVVIPVFNFEPQLTDSIASAIAGDAEVIIVAAGETKETRRQAIESRAVFIESKPGRGQQMNLGRQFATGECICFLHADTVLPTGAGEMIRDSLSDPSTSLVAFRLQIDSRRRLARGIEKLVDWRTRILRLPYGDQAMTFRRDDFDALGGFPDMPLMEDYEMSRRASRLGKVRLLDGQVATSDRRWRKKGYLRTTMINQAIILGYRFGVSPARLARWYRGKKR